MWRKLLLISWVALMFAGACVPPPPDDDRIVNFDPEVNLMGQIQERGVLRAGVEEDLPPWASFEGSTMEGFTVELARIVAESLGVEVDLVPAEASEMPAMIAGGDLDIGFPLTPITEDLLAENGLSDPYWVGHQRLLVTEGSQIREVADLGDRTVCSMVDPDTGIPVETLNPAAEVTEPAAPGECLSGLTSGRVDAVAGPDVVLLSLAAREEGLALVGDDITTEGYGAMVAPATGGFNSYVDAVLAEVDRESDWTAIYERWVAPVTDGEPPGYPTMTLEQAAALFPSESE